MIDVGVKHGRDYSEILSELTEAVGRISDGYIFFEMGNVWSAVFRKEGRSSSHPVL